MEKREMRILVDAVACAASKDENRTALFNRIALYRVDAMDPDGAIMLAATDGHRVHMAATAKIRDFEDAAKRGPVVILDARRMVAWLKMFKPKETIHFGNMFDSCREKDLDRANTEFPPFWQVCGSLVTDRNEGTAILAINPQYLADLKYFKYLNSASDDFLGVQILFGETPLDPITATACDYRDSRFFAAVIMPCRL